MDTLSKEELARTTKSTISGPVIYFLFYRKEIVYVGQTGSGLFARLGQHQNRIKFDSYAYIPASRKKMERETLELQYIRKFCHKWNCAGIPRLSIEVIDRTPKPQRLSVTRKRIAFHISNKHKGSLF